MNVFEAALFDELEPLYPDTNPRGGASVYQISVPSGTYAGVHIMLSGLTPGKFVTFEATPPLRTTETARDDAHV